MEAVYLGIVLAPLAAAALAGLGGPLVGRAGAHRLTIAGVSVSFVLSLVVLWDVLARGAPAFDGTVYEWATVGDLRMQIGFLIDRLTALMIMVVTFVSLVVHVYSIGYMRDDPGYARFFSYISLFTFAMLMLVMSNNFLQLFFGWEAVGVVSYLLICFWYRRESAVFAGFKAFLVNRVGDLGFLLGIAVLVYYTGTLDYAPVFGEAERLSGERIDVPAGGQWPVLTLACIGLFIGAMGKSAQVPLHVWLPDSMEGPTPISALIHAATMVTAGIFMVARMSPLFEHSQTALTLVLAIGAVTALAMGLLAVVQQDIKRVVAYSTLSQLGYMTAALGASAYAAGIFHLATHAFFKALLFLAAGSVIVALHHEQDIRRMGGLKRYLPITYWTALIGTLALVGFPGFSGFFSKDALIEAVALSATPGAPFAYWCLLMGVFVTAVYGFRLLFVVFHGQERFNGRARARLREPPRVVTWPLIVLAVPALLAGWFMVGPLLFGGFFADSILVLEARDPLAALAETYIGPVGFVLHAFTHSAVLYFAAAGAAVAWLLYLRRPELPGRLQARFAGVHRVLVEKYYFDWVNEKMIAPAVRALAERLWRLGDQRLIDGVLVNGSARTVEALASAARRIQTGYLYHYAFTMMIALALLIGWFVLGR